MTQKSYPWGYQESADSMTPYTAKEWYAVWTSVAKAGGMVIDSGIGSSATIYNRGPFYSIGNHLAVTSPGANRIAVDTGAALVDGAFFYNTASISSVGNITSPAANPRIDRVVIRKNYAAADYVPASASAADFTVPTLTARATIIHGAEAAGPVAPALTQDTTRATYWDIPLYQYQISVAGAITSLTDQRNWTDALGRQFFVPAVVGYNATNAANIIYTGGTSYPNTIALADTKDSLAYGSFVFPTDYIGAMVVKGILVCASGGGNDINASNRCNYGACGEATNTHADTTGTAAEATTTGYSCNRSLTIASGVAGDIMWLFFERDATVVADTIGDTVYFYGWMVTYLGWR